MEKLSKILIIILLIIVVVGAGFVFFYVTTIGFPVQKSDVFIPTVSEDNVSAYKESCAYLNGDLLYEVHKNQQSLIGTKVKVEGELLQKQENFVGTTFSILKSLISIPIHIS
nr:hypothetical protein [uncultured Methanobacterium sp.]